MSSENKSPLTVLWATGIDYNVDWESSWVMELLEGVDYTIRNVTMMNDIVPNALIVVNHNIMYVQYLQQYQNAGIPFGLIHVSMSGSMMTFNHTILPCASSCTAITTRTFRLTCNLK